MFFDISSPRVSRLLCIAGMLAIMTTWTTVLWFANRPLERAIGEAFARARSEVEYTLRFKLPDTVLAAVGGARAAGLSVQAPPSGPAVSVPVLVYHGEGGGPSMTTATFVSHMHAIHGAGWRTITMEQFGAFMRGEASVPDKSFLLTFDDGRTEAFYASDPVLKDLGYSAVMFVITGQSLPDNRDTAVNGFYLNKNELAYMQASGRWELESHGEADHRGYDVPTASSTAASLTMVPSTHFLSNLFWLSGEGRLETTAEFQARIKGDLALTNERLTQNFGRRVTGYAYPFNDFGQESVNFPDATAAIDEVVSSLYDYAFYQTWSSNGDSFNYPDRGSHLVKRLEPEADWSGRTLLATLEGGRSKGLPYTTTGYFGEDWRANWGLVTGGKALRLVASDRTSGAAVFLDGTEGWTDYTLSATANVTYGTISLIARHTVAPAPYLVCAFSTDHIYLEKHERGVQTTLATALFTPPALPATYRIAMRVVGTEASCSAYGVTVRASALDVSTRGGVGISIWSPQLGQAGSSVTDLSVGAL